MKKNNILITVLIGLILLFVVTNYFKKNSSVNFKPEIIKLDSSQVYKVIIKPPSITKEAPITILRENNTWNVMQGNINNRGDLSIIKSALGELSQIKNQQLVAKTKDKWEKYNLTDSLAHCIEIYEHGKEKATKLFLGKTSYKQSASSGYGRNPSIETSVYFRKNSNPKTYVAKGDISTVFKAKFNRWRNTEFTSLDKNVVTELNFESNENNFSLVKKDSLWLSADVAMNTAKIDEYLSVLTNQSGAKFMDNFKPKDEANYKLSVKGKSMENLIVKAYSDSISNKFILNSSQHPNVFFESDSTGLFKQVFVNKDYFLK